MKEKKLPIFFFSLVFAILVWVSVNLGNEFQAKVVIPVSVENIPPTKSISSLLPESISLKIQGTGWQLLNTILSPNLRYTLDFNKLLRRDTLFTYNNVGEHVQLPHDIHIFEISPETISVTLDSKVTKSIPVIPDVIIAYRNGFDIVGKINVSPESVTVVGARSLLASLHGWKTKLIQLKDVNAPVKVTADLMDTLSLEIEKPQFKSSIFFDVQPIAEKTVDDIPVLVNQVPHNRTIVIIPPKISIIIRSGVNTVASLTEKDFQASIDYTSILLDTSGMIQPLITGPSNVRIVQMNPEKIQYVVRK
jgi:YbbR domain-containing protein